MEVKPGYKQTEVGVIPEEWEVLPITSLLQKGSRITYGVVKPGSSPADGVLFIRGGDVFDGRILSHQLRTISKEISNQYKRTRLIGGEILISLVGYPGEVARVPTWLAGANIARQVALVRLDSSQPISGDYVCKFLQSNQGRRLLLKESIGSAQQVINLRDITRVVLVLPLEAEQRAIAAALSDVDGLLGGLDQLITKKRDLKQAAMQQLLTGQTRLPGFQGPWEETTLGKIGKFKNGLNKDSSAFGHGLPFVNLMDVFGVNAISSTSHLGLVASTKMDREVYDLRHGDVLFIRSSVKPSGVGLTAVVERDLTYTVYSGFLIRFRDEGALDSGFKKHCFYAESFRKKIIAASSVSANTNINQNALGALTLLLPPTKAEQTAIAEVLTEMDAELAVLEQRREKTRALKQAMMQELLTGRTRLI